MILTIPKDMVSFSVLLYITTKNSTTSNAFLSFQFKINIHSKLKILITPLVRRWLYHRCNTLKMVLPSTYLRTHAQQLNPVNKNELLDYHSFNTQSAS